MSLCHYCMDPMVSNDGEEPKAFAERVRVAIAHKLGVRTDLKKKKKKKKKKLTTAGTWLGIINNIRVHASFDSICGNFTYL